MAKRVAFSGQHLELNQIVIHHKDVECALRNYFNSASVQYLIRFAGYVESEIREELELRLMENEKLTILTMLATLEATFRIDYLQRSYQKRKDELSRAFRQIHKEHGSRASLEDGILEAWKNNSSVMPSLIGDIRGAFKYRHWLAHGRYWEPKLGRKYDYDSVYGLAERVYSTFPFEGIA